MAARAATFSWRPERGCSANRCQVPSELQGGLPDLAGRRLLGQAEASRSAVTAAAEQAVELGHPLRPDLDGTGAERAEQAHLLELVRAGRQLLDSSQQRLTVGAAA